MLMMTSTEVLGRVSMRGAIQAVERAFAALGGGKVQPPVSVGVPVPAGTFHVKACASASDYARIFVAKINSNFPGNCSCYGLSLILVLVVLFDFYDGRLVALLDSP